jgi:hypothetical protein
MSAPLTVQRRSTSVKGRTAGVLPVTILTAGPPMRSSANWYARFAHGCAWIAACAIHSCPAFSISSFVISLTRVAIPHSWPNGSRTLP